MAAHPPKPASPPPKSPKQSPKNKSPLRSSSTPPPDPKPAPAPAPAPAPVKQVIESTTSNASDGDIINMEVFDQILELDEGDESREFSGSTVQEYIDQVEMTLKKMRDAYDAKQLGELGDLGHFLKGSSAALGVQKLQHSCERMQYVGAHKDGPEGPTLTEEDALKVVKELLTQIDAEFREAEDWLNHYFGFKKEGD